MPALLKYLLWISQIHRIAGIDIAHKNNLFRYQFPGLTQSSFQYTSSIFAPVVPISRIILLVSPQMCMEGISVNSTPGKPFVKHNGQELELEPVYLLGNPYEEDDILAFGDIKTVRFSCQSEQSKRICCRCNFHSAADPFLFLYSFAWY